MLTCLATVARAQSVATAGSDGDVKASASLMDTEGRGVGLAYLRQTPRGVLLRLVLNHATPGIHAVHIHETGRCTPPSFESAGQHFNPGAKQHGFLDPDGAHAGDLPNLNVPGTTELTLEYMIAGVTLEPGPRSLLDADGSALVIHAGEDDYMTDPSGSSGERLACGVIVG
jgi:Cu-Zn family superoxide dismutase